MRCFPGSCLLASSLQSPFDRLLDEVWCIGRRLLVQIFKCYHSVGCFGFFSSLCLQGQDYDIVTAAYGGTKPCLQDVLSMTFFNFIFFLDNLLT